MKSAIPDKKVQEPQDGVADGNSGSGNPGGMTQPWVTQEIYRELL